MWGVRNMKYQRCARRAWTLSRVPGRRSTLQLSGCALSFFCALSVANLAAQDTARQFAGRWDLTLVGASKNLPSWIDVSQDSGQLKVTFVGVTDHATWMKDAKVSNGALTFVSPKGQEGFAYDTTYTLKRVGDRLEGTVSNADKKWSVTGKHAPTLAKSTAEWGKPVRLFNGRDLAGWSFSDPAKANSWKVVDGNLVSTGHGSEIISVPRFLNFKLHIEFNAGPNSNSGVFLRGRDEVQIETDSISEPPSHHTGGVYGFLDPIPEQPRVPDKWQSFDITFIGRTVTVVQNGVPVIDHKEIPGITGGALDSNEGSPGPIYLQGTEKGRVAFRNIVITPAKD
jgi:hypothetical protein